jgi:hypothetical protein
MDLWGWKLPFCGSMDSIERDDGSDYNGRADKQHQYADVTGQSSHGSTPEIDFYWLICLRMFCFDKCYLLEIEVRLSVVVEGGLPERSTPR